MPRPLYASFILDRSAGLEIALEANAVTEATVVTGAVTQLPTMNPYVQGVMKFRRNLIPLINMKKRLGLDSDQYDENAKIAVVSVHQKQYGLLFDEINDVFSLGAGQTLLEIDPALQTEDSVISSCINFKNSTRVVELLNLGKLFPGQPEDFENQTKQPSAESQPEKRVTYLRYVIFQYGDQLYGCPVENIREILFAEQVSPLCQFLDNKNSEHVNPAVRDLYRHVEIDGCITVRNQIISVLNTGRLLPGRKSSEGISTEEERVLVLQCQDCCIGLTVERVKTIDRIPENKILPGKLSNHPAIQGIYRNSMKKDIILLNIENLLESQIGDLSALYRLSRDSRETVDKRQDIGTVQSRHLMIEQSYLIFNIGRTMAVPLENVREIIEKSGVLILPGKGAVRGIINLRGQVIPVINLKKFYGLETAEGESGEEKGEKRLIICKSEQKSVALEVDSIETIYKHDDFQKAVQLKKDLKDKKDTLDRLIVYRGKNGIQEQVLVTNIYNLIHNYVEAQEA